jgi:hypothetical protein
MWREPKLGIRCVFLSILTTDEPNTVHRGAQTDETAVRPRDQTMAKMSTASAHLTSSRLAMEIKLSASDS